MQHIKLVVTDSEGDTTQVFPETDVNAIVGLSDLINELVAENNDLEQRVKALENRLSGY